jgi:hypothetical protein
MDIRAYFQKVREIERGIANPYVVVVSLATSEGGKPGCMTEVSRAAAAQMIADSKARLADDAERAEFHKRTQQALAVAEEERMAGKIQLTVVSEHLPRSGKPRSGKE